MNYDYNDFRFQFEEFINGLEWEIYSTEKPVSKEDIRYAIVTEDGHNPLDYFERPKEYTDRKEALRILKKYARIAEKGEDGKTHFYREYTSCTADECVVKREELKIIEIDKGYHPEHSDKVLEMMKKCLMRFKETNVYARNITRLMNGDCGEETFVKDMVDDIRELRKKPLVDKEYFEEMKDHD